MSSPWAGGLGRAGLRGTQVQALTAVAALVLCLLMTIEVVVLAALVALVLASAVHLLVRRLEDRGWNSSSAAVAVFPSLLGLLGGVVTGVDLGIRGVLDELANAATAGWQHFQELLAAGPLPVPVDPATVSTAVAKIGDYLGTAGARQSALSGLTVASEALTGTVLLAIVLWAVGVPLVVALTAVVFLTAFVPVVGAVLGVALTVVAWAVLQVWTTRYQSGDDLLLGADPVSPAEGVADRVSRIQHRKHQRMRHQVRPAPWAAPRALRPRSRTQSPP